MTATPENPIDPQPVSPGSGDGRSPEPITTRSTTRRRLSFVRVLIALLLVGGVVLGGITLGQAAVQRSATGRPDAWFAPYVDATLVPTFPFEDPVEAGTKDSILSFVVAERDGGCTPTWGTYVDLEGAATSFDLDRRIARLRAAGGDAIVSFGGATNTELAVACSTTDELTAAYRSVVDRYQLSTIDLDLEGVALRDTGAADRRAQAVAALQRDAVAAGRPLAVWLTLPVDPNGLTAEGTAVVGRMLAAGVDLAGVNAMIMDYGGSRSADQSMADANTAALLATSTQVAAAYLATGRALTDEQVWARIGATPMIGQNDTPADRFTLDDAAALASFAKVHGLGRLSMWSANRDAPCGKQMDPHVVSTTCSGEEQGPLDYTRVLGTLTGRTGAAVGPGTTGPAAATRQIGTTGPATDDAESSPYPLWQTDRVYDAGQKVVWHRNVYVAKWWTQGDTPDRAVEHLWDSPWRYLGPVLTTDAPAPKPNLPAGTYPEWSRTGVYAKGKRVLFHGMAYEAKWWTQGDTPNPDRAWETPWQPVAAVAVTPTPAMAALPQWDGKQVYVTGDQVLFQGTPFEATRWNQSDMPVVSDDSTTVPTWKAISPDEVRALDTASPRATTAVPAPDGDRPAVTAPAAADATPTTAPDQPTTAVTPGPAPAG